MGQLRMPAIPPGNLRKLLEDLHVLHRRAGWPSTRDMAKSAEFTYGAVHDLFTKPRTNAPNHRVLLTVVERLASMSRGIDDVDRVLDDFDCKWRDAAEQPFDENTSGLRLMAETDPERLSRIAHLTPATPTTVDTPAKFDKLGTTATDRTPHGRLETDVGTPNLIDGDGSAVGDYIVKLARRRGAAGLSPEARILKLLMYYTARTMAGEEKIPLPEMEHLITKACGRLGLTSTEFDRKVVELRKRYPDVFDWRAVTRAGDEELLTFMDAWGRPVFEAAKTLLCLARDALRGQDELPKRDLAVLYQRVYDEADRAYSLAFNATKGLDGSPEPEAAVGDFHRHYQAMVTWICKGFEHAVLDRDSIWYREWYTSDARFMDELRQTAAHLGRSALRENLRAAGFNEGVRHELPAPRPRG